MPDSPSKGVADEDEFRVIEDLVGQAKEFEDAGEVKKAKNAYLDAAQEALKLSKIRTGIDKLSYEQIARSLVDYVKELNLLLQMEQHPLPSIPGTTKAEGKQKSVVTTAEELVEVRSVLLEIMIVAAGGMPIFDYYNEDVSQDLKRKVNEILFSGALTAINQLMSEIIERPIQRMSFEGATIYLKKKSDYTFVFLSQSDDLDLEKILNLMSTEFFSLLTAELETNIKQGQTVNNHPKLLKLVERILSQEIAKPPR